MFNRFYRLEIQSLIGWYFRPSLWTVAPMDEGTILVYCCPSVFSLTSSPPSQTKCTVYTDSVCLRGEGGVWIVLCRPYSAGILHILHSVSDQIQNLPNYFTTPNKMTSENDIEGLVSLKFLHPWFSRTGILQFSSKIALRTTSDIWIKYHWSVGNLAWILFGRNAV